MPPGPVHFSVGVSLAYTHTNAHLDTQAQTHTGALLSVQLLQLSRLSPVANVVNSLLSLA